MNNQEPLPNHLIKQQQEVDSYVYNPFCFGADLITLKWFIKYFIFNGTIAFINNPLVEKWCDSIYLILNDV